MHIIAPLGYLDNRRGGTELAAFEILKGLVDRGHELTVVSRRLGNLTSEYKRLCDNRLVLLRWDNGLSPLAQSLYKTFKKRIQQPQTIVYSNAIGSAPSLILSKILRCPYVWHLHCPPPSRPSWYFNFGLSRVANFIVVSHQTAADWENYGIQSSKIRVIHNGIDLQRFSPAKESAKALPLGLTPHSKVIGYVGRLDQVKGIPTLIDAFKILAKRLPNIDLRLLLAGRPVSQGTSFLDSLKSTAGHLHEQGKISFLGHTTNPTSVYHLCDLSVLPSLWSEPFGLSVLESMACGVPVVASRIGGIPEVFGEEFKEQLFTAGNSAELADKIENFVFWKEKNANLGERCRKHIVNNFSTEKAVLSIEQVLTQVSNQQSRKHAHG